jgi:DNA-directed RNA polymerase specialized sigma24 family protein
VYGVARKLTRHNPYVRDDLMQVAALRLLSLRLNGVRNPRTYILQACKFAMIDELRRLKLERTLSFIDAHYLGYEFVQLPDGTVEGRTVRTRQRPKAVPDWMLEVNALGA